MLDDTRVDSGSAPVRLRLRRLFIGPFGVRCGWRFVLFLVIATLLVAGLAFGVKQIEWVFPRPFRPLPNTAAPCLGVLAATWILSRLDRKPISYFGLGPVNRTRNFLTGIATGFLSLSLLMALLVATRVFRPGPLSLTGLAALGWGSFWVLAFVCVGFTEELMLRGYPLFALSQGIGFWPAAILTSILFGAGHLGNKGEDYIGVAAAMLVGVVLAFSLRWTGTLWWAIGFHLSWDWSETFFFGVSDSGQPSPQHFLSGKAAGPSWLSGGSVGPEGSILVIPVLLLLVAVVRFALPRAHAPGLDRLRRPQSTASGALDSVPM